MAQCCSTGIRGLNPQIPCEQHAFTRLFQLFFAYSQNMSEMSAADQNCNVSILGLHVNVDAGNGLGWNGMSITPDPPQSPLFFDLRLDANPNDLIVSPGRFHLFQTFLDRLVRKNFDRSENFALGQVNEQRFPLLFQSQYELLGFQFFPNNGDASFVPHVITDELHSRIWEINNANFSDRLVRVNYVANNYSPYSPPAQDE